MSINPNLVRDEAAALRTLEESVPYPIAQGLKSYRDIPMSRYSERLDALFKVCEVTTKLLAAMAAKLYLLDGATDEGFRSTLQAFRRPSLGSWVALLRGALSPASGRSDDDLLVLLKEWVESPISHDEDAWRGVENLARAVQIQRPKGALNNGKVLDFLVAFRNKTLGHGSRVTAHEYQERHDELLRVVAPWLSGLRSLEDYPLAFVEEVRVRRGDFYQTVRVGWGRELELREVRSDEPLLDNRLYCFRLSGDNLAAFALDLSPFLLFHACPSCRTHQLFVFNGQAKAVEYLSYGCGHFLIVDEPSGELVSIQRFLSGQMSLHQLFQGKILGRRIEPGPVGPSREARQRAAELVSVAQSILKSGLPSEAISALREALALNPDSEKAHLALGIAQLAGKEEPDHALQTLMRATKLNPDFAQAHYAVGHVARFLRRDDVAHESFARARSLDPSDRRFHVALADARPTSEADMGRDADEGGQQDSQLAALVAELLREDTSRLPPLRWWIVALPPWSWVAQSPFVSSITLVAAFLLIVLLVNADRLSPLRIGWFVNVSSLQLLGLLSPFLFARFAGQLFSQLRPVVNLPEDTFRRWYLAEILPFAGSFHILGRDGRYGVRQLFATDRTLLLLFAGGLLLFLPFQAACAMGMDPFVFSTAGIVTYAFYFFEVFALAWIPAFVIRALGFIPGFYHLPIRHFVDMPSSVSLRPLGTFYLKIASLGTLAFVLFTTQHYLFRTHETVPVASVGFIVVVYSFFFAVMFASQGVIMLTMTRLRERRLIEYSHHLERAFDESLKNPSERSFENLQRHRDYMRALRHGLSISGFTPQTLTWFAALAVLQMVVLGAYFALVSRGVWVAL